MYKVSISVLGSYSSMTFNFKTMKEAADFVDKCFKASEEMLECKIYKEEDNNGK